MEDRGPRAHSGGDRHGVRLGRRWGREPRSRCVRRRRVPARVAVRGRGLGRHVRARHAPDPVQHGGHRGRQADRIGQVPARAPRRNQGRVDEAPLRARDQHRGQQAHRRVPDRRQGQGADAQAGAHAPLFRQAARTARRRLQLGVPQRRGGVARFASDAEDHPARVRSAQGRDGREAHRIDDVLPRRQAGEDLGRFRGGGARRHGARDGLRLWTRRPLHDGTRRERNRKHGAPGSEQVHRDVGSTLLRQEQVAVGLAHVRGFGVGASQSRDERRRRRGPQRGV